MSLLGAAAIAIWCDVPPAQRAAHDAWHSGEHLAERVAIPGFLRGRRTVAADPAAKWPYFMLYEVDNVAVTVSPAYLERLNNPTPWSQQVFPSVRLRRALCRVAASHGNGVGAHLATVTLGEESLLPQLAGRPGVAGVHLLERDRSISRPRTREESLRGGGGDETVERVLVVEGYDAGLLEQALAGEGLAGERYLLSHLMNARTP